LSVCSLNKSFEFGGQRTFKLDNHMYLNNLYQRNMSRLPQ
jgi:hypothetical protein